MAWYTDRMWMYERIDSDGFLNSKYCDNVDLFLEFAFSNGVVDTRVNMHGETIRDIKCPCYKCQNISYRDKPTIQKHLYKEGFMLRYETRSEHGGNTIRDVGQSSTNMEVDNDDGYKRTVLDSMYACSYTSSTLEGNTPNPEAKKFYDMLQAVDEPLWEGKKATNCSKLQAVTSFLTWKSLFNVSTAAYNYNISMVNALLPEENKLSKSFYDTKKSLEKLSLPYERIDICKNHCMLFYKQDKALTQLMSYMPIGPRLKRLYMSTKTAKDMTCHHQHNTKKGSMAHPSDSVAWKHFDLENPEFAKEIQNDSFIELCLIIPGGKSPGQNIDVFLRPLIDELKELYKEGIGVHDAYRKENLIMRAILLWTVSDFPAYAMLSGVNCNSKHKDPEFGKTHNWVEKSNFWELEYWPMLLIRHNLDVMHIKKNVFENLFQMVTDTSKTKDNVMARKDVE
ncbi:uncharacterized protein LOC143585475 [Bidens hawaiensis]|uniref:uncharacterized protein LOC143585475 n=1 Tax=Bidens hawaiensis TaxID=980011 RepID=UPI00404A7C22